MNPPTPAPPLVSATAGSHYENFPVASWLCPPALRPPIAALYRFARTADDMADEGDATADERLADLHAYRDDLIAAAAAKPVSPRWPEVFPALTAQIAAWRLPAAPLLDLIDAFAQDVAYTRDGRSYADRPALLDYCRRSANPVGRLLLHLYGVTDPKALARSDAICTALQLANFWQDLSVDIPRGRHYLTDADCRAHGVDRPSLAALQQTPGATALIADCVRWARASMHDGAPLVHAVPGRAGWELRLVVQGGLRILDRIRAIDHATLRQRPVIGARDVAPMLWRAVRM